MVRYIRAFRAWRYYKHHWSGYSKNMLPCMHCIWVPEPEHTDFPWQWILCDKCDWGNH